MISNYSIHHTKLFFGFIRLEYSKQTKWTAFMLLVLLRSLTVMVTIKKYIYCIHKYFLMKTFWFWTII